MSAGRVTVDFSFAHGADGWGAIFADYPRERAAFVLPEARIVALPPELGNGLAFRLSSAGNEGALFSGLWRPVTGLRPNTSYRVQFSLTLASNLAPGCVREGEGQIVKGGASGIVPLPSESGTPRLPIDKGGATGSGRNMVAVGDLTIPTISGCDANNPFRTKAFSFQDQSLVVASDSAGRLWLVAGIDSGFTGPTLLYILGGRFSVTPI